MWWWWPLLARLLVASRWRDAVWDAVSLCESEPSTLNLTVDDTEERLMHLIRLSKAPMHLPVVHLLQHWELFGKKDRLLESDDIKAQRLDVFKANQDIIHQSKGSPYTLGETIFMDMLAHEVKRMFPAKNKRSHHDSGVGAPVALDRNAGETTALPPALDWSLTGCVGPVTNQGNCGACYALASTSSHESSLCLRNLRRLAKDLDDRPGETVEQRFVRAEKRSAMVDVWAFRDLGTPVSPFHSASVPEQPYSQSEHLTLLSAQQTVDCSSEYGNSGCAGGDFRPAFEYLMKRPLCLDQDYSYAEADSPCLASSCVKSNWRRWMMTDFGVVVGDEEDLKAVLFHYGPLAVAIESNHPHFFLYKGGVLQDSFDFRCDSNVDHAMLLVGYGTDPDGTDYWLLRNSWSTKWGYAGYGRVLRGSGKTYGECGILVEPHLAVAN